ncbi:MAG: cation diffusion facilitator family transporter [Lachnospiraceae bacterium]|nr:cation diffusion facilitator family transporter [Lachnospiraceae bacterium]
MKEEQKVVTTPSLTVNQLDQTEKNRNQVIVRTSVIGIVANVFLVIFKAMIGVLSNSIAVILDAVNNLADALGSIITIIGTKLAGKRPDQKHPFGYGRIEYLSAMVLSAIVLYAGVTSLIESIKKIIHPETPDYSMVSLIIIAVAVVVKLVLGQYVKKTGEKVNSNALIASGTEAGFDAIVSASVLACAIFYMFTKVSLEAYIGVIISILIAKSGLEILIETINELLGQRADAELAKSVKRAILADPEVRGAYDLIFNNYGPEHDYASVHIELPDTMTVKEVDEITRRISQKVYCETGVVLTAVSIYSYNTKNPKIIEMRDHIFRTVLAHDYALQVHGFYVEEEIKVVRLDVVLTFDVEPQETMGCLREELKGIYPEYEFYLTPDIDVTDL